MQQSLRARWNRWQQRRRFLCVVGIVALSAVGGAAHVQGEDVPGGNVPVISQDQIDEIESKIARMEKAWEVGTKSEITMVCDDDSCRGYYDDIFTHTLLDHEGKIFLFVTPEVTPFLAASSHACARDNYIVAQLENEASGLKRDAAYRMLTQLQMAQALGHEVEVQWEQSNYNPGWMVCKVDIVYVYGPPAP